MKKILWKIWWCRRQNGSHETGSAESGGDEIAAPKSPVPAVQHSNV